LRKLIALMDKGEWVDWGTYTNREISKCLDLYTSVGWCKKTIKTPIAQMQSLLRAIENVNEHVEKVLDSFILRKPYLRKYMILHSVFPVEYKQNHDWLQGYMARRLMPTDREVEEWLAVPELPPELAEQFAAFDPKPISQHMQMDNVRLEYQMFGNVKRGESDNPINAIDIDWEKIEAVDIAEIIQAIPEIDLRRNDTSPVCPVSTNRYLDDYSDLPF